MIHYTKGAAFVEPGSGAAPPSQRQGPQTRGFCLKCKTDTVLTQRESFFPTFSSILPAVYLFLSFLFAGLDSRGFRLKRIFFFSLFPFSFRCFSLKIYNHEYDIQKWVFLLLLARWIILTVDSLHLFVNAICIKYPPLP